jgi:hypothetical protein
MVKKGTYVSIRQTILECGQRAAGIPEDTAKTPLLAWISGHLIQDAMLEAQASITTKTGRVEHGILEEIEPFTNVDYGGYVKELGQLNF